MKMYYRKILFTCCLGLTLSACEAAKIESINGQIEISPNQVMNQVPEEIFGQNIQWTQGGDGLIVIHNENSKKWNTALVNEVRDLDIPLLRFPGGELANTFEWKNSIGPISQRKSGSNFADKPEDYLFGVDEFIELCETISTKAVVTLNLNTSDEDLFGLIDYFQARPQCPVKYWEFGNEVYAHGTLGSMTVDEYAQRVSSLSMKLRARYKSLQLGAAFELSFQEAAWMANVFPHLLTWNQSLIEKVALHIDFAVIHFYAPFDKDFNRTTENRLLLSSPEVFERSLAKFKKMVNKYNSAMQYGVTEFNSFFGSKLFVSKNVSSTISALYNSILFSKFVEGNIDFANYWSLINNGQFGLLQSSGETISYGSFYPLWRELKKFSGLTQVASQVNYQGGNNLEFSVQAKGNVPADDDVSALDTFAVHDANGNYRLMIVNRSHNHEVALGLPGLREGLTVNTGNLFRSAKDYRSWLTTKLNAGQQTLLLPPLSIVFMELVKAK